MPTCPFNREKQTKGGQSQLLFPSLTMEKLTQEEEEEVELARLQLLLLADIAKNLSDNTVIFSVM